MNPENDEQVVCVTTINVDGFVERLRCAVQILFTGELQFACPADNVTELGSREHPITDEDQRSAYAARPESSID